MAAVEFRLKFYLSIFLVIIVTGPLSFILIEDLTLGASLYFMIVTIATAGSGDFHPDTRISPFNPKASPVVG